MMKVAIVLRSTEHQPVSTTIVFTSPYVSGLVDGFCQCSILFFAQRSTEHQPVATTIAFTSPYVSGLVDGFCQCSIVFFCTTIVTYSSLVRLLYAV